MRSSLTNSHQPIVEVPDPFDDIVVETRIGAIAAAARGDVIAIQAGRTRSMRQFIQWMWRETWSASDQRGSLHISQWKKMAISLTNRWILRQLLGC